MQDTQGIKWLWGVELRPGMTLPLPASQKPRFLFVYLFFFISNPQSLGSETPASPGPEEAS